MKAVENKMYLDYYNFFNLPKNATTNQIKEAYKRKLIEFHPDKLANKSDEEKRYFSKQLEIAKNGLDILTNPTSRRNYDLKYSKLFSGYNNHPNEQENIINFNEIINLETRIIKISNQMNELHKIYCKLRKNSFQLAISKDKKIEEFKKILEEENKYIEAITFINSMLKKDDHLLMRAFMTKKDLQRYNYYQEIVRIYEKQISNYEKKLDLEIKNAYEKAKEKKKEWNTLYQERRKLEEAYRKHPLYYKYQDSKKGTFSDYKKPIL